jgi:hypothetical protein
MRRALVYFAGLGVAAVVVFFATYFLGRHSTLEGELERLTAPRAAPDTGKSRGIPSLQPVEPAPEAAAPENVAGEALGEGIAVTRSALEPAGVVIVADLPALAPPAAGRGASLGDGLTAFLSRPPSGPAIGLRALAGATDDCRATDGVLPLGKWPAGAGAAPFDAAAGRGLGPRNAARALEAAAEELGSVPGERAVVLLAGGDEGCGADFCGAAGPPGGAAQRVHVILLATPPQAGIEPGMPEAGTDAAPRPVFEPPWAAGYRCLAERSGGTIGAVSSAAELESALRRIAGDLESAVVVRAFHYTGEEVKGISPGGEAAWGASMRPSRDADAADAGRLRESDVFPAAFSVAAGVYVVKARYAGQARTAAVAVAPAERAEVRVRFATGEVFLQALDAAGREIVGDSTGFRCAWGAEALAAGNEEDAGAKPAASSCSFPARLELAPGSYRLRVRWKGIERMIDEVTVEAGASAVHTVSFGADGT